MERVSWGMAMEMRITIMVTTTISSTKVKPRLRRRDLPFCIGCTIGGLVIGLTENLENALSSPAFGFWVVLWAARAPLVFARKGIFGDAAQEFQLGAVGIVGQNLAFHQHIQGIGIAVGPQFWGAEIARVAIVLVLVD